MVSVSRTILRELSRIAFDPDIPRLQKQIYQSLVLGILAERNPNELFSTQDVCDSITRDLDVESVPVILVDHALRVLAENGLVNPEDDGWVLLQRPPVTEEGPFSVVMNGFMGKLESNCCGGWRANLPGELRVRADKP